MCIKGRVLPWAKRQAGLSARIHQLRLAESLQKMLPCHQFSNTSYFAIDNVGTVGRNLLGYQYHISVTAVSVN